VKSIADILEKFSPTEDKYVSREFQTFGVFLAEKLGDLRRKPLYIKYAKEIPRPILEKAYRFVIDSKARNKGALFMCKLKELGVFTKFKLEPIKRSKKTAVGAIGEKVVKPKKVKPQLDLF
jgi:hypothetical protein